MARQYERKIVKKIQPKTTKSFFNILVLLFTGSLAFVLVSPIAANAAGPNLQTATVDAGTGQTVTLTFDDLGGTTQSPTRTDFVLTGSNQGVINLILSSRSENIITLRTGTVVLANQTISLTYTPTTNVPANAANEPLAGFTTAVTHLAANVPINFEITANSANLSQIKLENFLFRGIICSLSTTNFAVKVNGSPRSISTVSQTCTNYLITVTLSSPIVANDVVTISYIPSANSIKSYFGVAASAFSDSPVLGVPDTIAPTLNVQSVSNYQFGQGGNISLAASELVGWSITTDQTLSFQLAGDPIRLLVSSILPVGSYTVGLTAEDNAGNRTTRNITVNILAAGATPSPTPSVTATPQPSQPSQGTATVYKTCTLMNRKHLGGVAQSYSSRNKGAGMNYIARVDPALYKANIKLDKDKDGIACER